MNARRRGAVVLALLTLCAVPVAGRCGPTGQPSAALRARLEAAMRAPAGFDDHYQAEVWYVDMSGRLAPFMSDPLRRIHFLRIVHQEALRAHLEPELVLAVIQIESRFDRFAISRVGAQGYMQIMPFWLKEIGDPKGNLFDPRTNLRMGCTILRYYLDRAHGDWVAALARYNGSAGRADYPYRVLRALDGRWAPG